MWALVDCDNFFCSCERVFRPDLNARPVVVLSNNDGCVVARSREAKAMGIRMGLPYYQMLEQFPASGITAFSSNYRLYADMSARVMSVLRDCAPKILQYSIDEAFLDLYGLDSAISTSPEAISTSPEAISNSTESITTSPEAITDNALHLWGADLAAKVRKWTGISVSIGIAPTKTLAKVASRFAKNYPGYHKCCVIADDEQRMKALKLFDVADVWGIGRRISRRLQTLGVATAWDFTQKSRGWVKSRFHVPGERTWLELNGYEAIEVDAMEGNTKKSIVTSRSFPDMVTELDEIRPHVANFAARCAMKLRRQGSVCAMLNVFVQSNFFRDDLPQYACNSMHLFTTPTNTATELVAAAESVLRNIYRPGIHYKRAGVMVSEISSASAVQPDLFEFDSQLSRKYRSLSEAMDEINCRLGADTLILASQQFPQRDAEGHSLKYVNAIRRALKSPDYSTSFEAFRIAGE